MNDLIVDNPTGARFEVSPETRTIRGMALPYGVTARSNGQTWQFSRGSVTGDRVKLLADHDWSRAIGTVELEDTDEGLQMTARVARGAEGDRILALAEDGVYDGLSVGLGDDVKSVIRDRVQHVRSASVREVSVTPIPAFTEARVTSVAASAAQTKENSMPENTVEETPAAPVDFSGITEAIQAGFADLRAPQAREVVPATAAFEVDEPTPYRFDGVEGAHSFSEDMRDASQGDSAARQRLQEFGEQFAVSTGNVTTLNPVQNRPDLFVPNLTYTRPLWESVTTGTVTDKTPFTIPKFGTATGLVGPHTEGVEPAPGAFSATNQTITPSAISGKIEINREVLDQGGSPKADAIIWAEMLNAWYEALEARVATQLAAIATAELNLAGAVDAPLVNAMQNYFAGLQFVRGGNRFTGLVLDGQLFPALLAAADSTGRKLLPVLGPQNAQGTSSGGFDRVSIGNQTGRAAWALGATNASKSYSFVPSSVWAWASAPKRFDFQYQVKSVDMAIWGYAATAVTRDSDVKPIDYSTADA